MVSDRLVEVSDLIVDIGIDGARRPVRRDEVVERCHAAGDRWGARIAAALPAIDGRLDPDHVDRLLVAVHGEIQRLSEEFRHGDRMVERLHPVLTALRASDVAPPCRIVDVGCGTGYVLRAMAADVERLGTDVELVGVDLNPALVAAAVDLARRDGVTCRFEVADAFALAEPATVLISTGVVHHFRGPDLGRFFAAHQAGPAQAFVHVDFQPSAIAPLGAWLFHRTRMRLPLSRHDGIRSAQRAHDPRVLAREAAVAAPGFATWIWGRRVHRTPFPCVLTTLVGARHELRPAVDEAFGRRAGRLEVVR